MESPTSIPIAFFMFEFPAPINFIDVNFNATLCTKDQIENYFSPINGKCSNVANFFLLDEKSIKGTFQYRLHHAAVELFYATIKKQREMNYSQSEYDKCYSDMYKHSSKELFEMGTKFEAKKL